jgi:hypothetical protein
MSEPVVLRSCALFYASWVAAIGVGLLFGATTIGGPGPDPRVDDYIASAALGLPFMLGFYRATRLRLELTDDGVTMFRLFTTTRVAWLDISDISVDYYGLHVRRTDGAVVTAGFLGKPNWATWLGRRSRGDEVAELLAARVLAERGRTGQSDSSS